MGWLEDLADYLENTLTLGSPVFFEVFDSIPNCICFLHQSGLTNEHAPGAKTLHKSNFGIRIKNQDLETAESQAETLSSYLELKTGFWAGSTWFKRVTNENGFYHVSTDSTNGTVYTLNCYAEYEEA